MSYAPQGNLRKRHPEGSRVPCETALRYVKQVAAALQYDHDQHLIHRDLKPENLVLDANGELLLSDFGIAIVARSSHSQSVQDVVGTATYMSPEQLKGRPRPASDQYALATLAYEWLCGVPPFDGPTYLEIAKKHLSAPVLFGNLKVGGTVKGRNSTQPFVRQRCQGILVAGRPGTSFQLFWRHVCCRSYHILHAL